MDKSKIATFLYPFLYFVNYYRQKCEPLCFYSEWETIDLLQKGYSISRFGDGEINILLGISGVPEFQPFSRQLQEKLVECIKADAKDNPHFLVAPLASLGSMKGYNKEQKRFYATFYFRRRNRIIRSLPKSGKNQMYGDPLFARVFGYHTDDCVEKAYYKIERLNTIWKDKSVLVVEGTDSFLGVETDVLFSARSIKRIIVPSKNAFEKYEKILNAIKLQKDFDIILIIAGPTATALAYDCYKFGYQAIDFGQMQKKYISLAGGVFRHKTISKDEYANQIVATIE